jgi:hypothetical protein
VISTEKPFISSLSASENGLCLLIESTYGLTVSVNYKQGCRVLSPCCREMMQFIFTGTYLCDSCSCGQMYKNSRLKPFSEGKHTFKKALFKSLSDKDKNRCSIILPFSGKLTENQKFIFGEEMWKLSGQSVDEWATFSNMKKLQYAGCSRSVLSNVELNNVGGTITTSVSWAAEGDASNFFLLEQKDLHC